MTVAQRIYQKLAARFFGPFKIVEKIGLVAYKLDLPPSSRVHPIFHVSLLKKAVLSSTADQALPPELELDANDLPSPEEILAVRSVTQEGKSVVQWLIRW